MNKDVDPCKGCICTQCAKSDYNGAMYLCAMYLCAMKLCNNCEESEYIIKRSYCDEAVLLDDEDTDDLRL